MPTTKTEKIFLAYALIFGVLAGLCISAILQAIAVPSMSGFLLTSQEYADLTILYGKSNQVQSFINIGIGAGFVYLLLLLPVLNPNINLTIVKQPRKLIQLTVYIIAALVVTIGLSVRLDSFFGNMDNSLFIRIIGVAVPIVWWSILGEIGIAGDLSTWKPNHNPDIKTCILLAISTYFIFIVLSLADNWGFMWFFTLVSEVFDGSGEISVIGFNWLQGGIIILATCSSVSLAATIIALAPIKRQLHERTDKLILPIGLTISFTLMLSGGYYSGVLNYDLDKTSLADAIGSQEPAHSQKSRTAILQGDAITSTPWQTSINTFSLSSSSTLEATPDNIKLLEQYLGKNPRSIHHYSGKDGLVKIHFNLWDSELATLHQQQTQDNVVQRIFFLNRLGCLPVTAANRGFISNYEDDANWWVGSKAALLLANAAIHFNDFPKATKWLEIAKERGATDKALGTVTIPEQPQLITGTISGTIKTDRPVILGLLRANDEDHKVSLDTTYLSLNLVDSRTIDNSSSFSFPHIGAGRYFLALKYSGDKAEITMEENGIIELNHEQAKIDVGVIEINVTK